MSTADLKLAEPEPYVPDPDVRAEYTIVWGLTAMCDTIDTSVAAGRSGDDWFVQTAIRLTRAYLKALVKGDERGRAWALDDLRSVAGDIGRSGCCCEHHPGVETRLHTR